MLFFKTIQGTTYLSPSQLPALIIFIWIWNSWEEQLTKKRIIFHLITIGFGLHFRPELFGLIFFYKPVVAKVVNYIQSK